MRLLLTLLSALLLTTTAVQSQTQDQLPKVFILGEDEIMYERIVQNYNQSLLEASGNEVQMAFQNWVDMMREIDNYAETIRFDIKGVKVWLHVFWDADGSINHIGYLLRPDSRNINTAELSAFFSSFINRYTSSLTSDRNFSHYTGASFPTFWEKAERD